MRTARTVAAALAVVSIGALVQPEAAQVVSTAGTRLLIAQTSDAPSSDQRAAIAVIENMVASGDLRLIDRRQDLLMPGHVHERYQQTYGGLPVIGADVAVQRRAGQVLSSFGVVYRGLAIDVSPRQSSRQAASALRTRGFAAIDAPQAPMLILPTPDGRVSLVYAIRDDGGKLAYVDANDASIHMQLNEFQTQASVGTGTGVLGDSKKISTILESGSYVSRDGLRPPALETYDLRGDSARLVDIANGVTAITANDLARSTSNVWTDGAVVDAHVYAGWVYDYYYKRFQRRGLDDNNVRIQSITNPMRAQDFRTAPPQLQGLFVNAFYSRGCRCIVYGPGLPAGITPTFPNGVRNFAGSLDVVAHELTHAVTDASSRLIYANESGALNEAFSDIMGVSVEFFHQPTAAGAVTADYRMGENLSAPSSPALMRSLRTPTEFGQPDHYYLRSYIGATRDFDGGGVHINSGIANHAFYLAIEGGAHRSGLVVPGVGAANREQIEKVFYRAFTSMLGAASTFYQARLATIQSARDLYGTGGAVERAISIAWDAVGVSTPGAALTTQFSPPSAPANAAACSGGSVRPSFNFRASVSEFQGVGFNVSGFDIHSYDSSGRQIALDRFTSSTFRTWFSECQPANTRIAARSTACVSLCASLGGRSSGAAVLVFTGTDDNGNPGVFNSDYMLFGIPLGAEPPDATYGPVTYTKAVQQ